MITAPAIKLNDTVFSAPVDYSKPHSERARHDTVFQIIRDSGTKDIRNEITGFITDENVFLDRTQAMEHALQCSQIHPITAGPLHALKGRALISQDLW